MSIDSAELVLIFVLVVLTVLLLVLGIQVFFILRELRRTVTKANKVLSDTEVITGSVSDKISGASSLISGLKVGSIISILKIIKGVLTREEADSPEKKSRK